MYFARRDLPFLNNPKDLDLSYKMDIDFWDCFEINNLHLITKKYGIGTLPCFSIILSRGNFLFVSLDNVPYLSGYKTGFLPSRVTSNK